MQLRPRRTLLLLPLSTIFHRTPSSPATLFRCSFIASPSSRFQDPGDVTRDNSWVELARGMANEIANTVPVYVSPVYIGRPCCLCSFPLISPRLPATDLPSRFHRVYTRWIGVYSFLMPRGGSILLKERFYLYIFEGDIF